MTAKVDGCENHPERVDCNLLTTEVADKDKSGWTQIRCDSCGGHGVISVYSQNDFEGPGECRTCGGSGTMFLSPKGRLADYPGGPFRGRA